MAASYRVAEMSYKQQKWNDTVTRMKTFITRYEKDPAAGELVVQAYWRVAQARKAVGKQKDYEVALADVVSAYGKSGQPPGSMAAEYAAQAKFILVDKGVEEFERFQIKPGSPATMQAYVNELTKQIDAGATSAKQRNEAYDSVTVYRRPNWTIASFVRQGRVYEILARQMGLPT
jgi:cellulose synthase operon protein C